MEQARLDKILEQHKLWLKTNGEEGERADLCNADLCYANLRNANLCNADLRYADLCRANLCNANLRNADLCYANLRNANLCNADLRNADLRYADLCRANLCNANLRNADLDYSAFPLWCGGLNVHIDDRQATQILYHIVRNVQYSKNTSKALKKICRIKSLVNQANKFHRVEECGELKEMVGDSDV